MELHQSLSEFNKIYAEMRIGKSSILQYQLRKLHNRLMGLLNHVAQFDNKYIPVKKHIKKQYHDMISGKFQKPPKKRIYLVAINVNIQIDIHIQVMMKGVIWIRRIIVRSRLGYTKYRLNL